MIEHKKVSFFTVKHDDYRLETHLNKLSEVVHFIVIGDMSKHSLIVLLAIAEGQIALARFLFKEGYTCTFEHIEGGLKPPPDAISMFPVPKDAEEDVED